MFLRHRGVFFLFKCFCVTAGCISCTEALAEESDRVSFAKGEPFTDSKGVRQLEPKPEEANLVAIALDLYRKRRQ